MSGLSWVRWHLHREMMRGDQRRVAKLRQRIFTQPLPQFCEVSSSEQEVRSLRSPCSVVSSFAMHRGFHR